jgi:guanosine-3',5'-bis(diphosphate) 3'-pyrophosphohydrolase
MKSRDDAPLLLRAIAFAADRHRTQRRKDRAATPYINHPIDVAWLLAGVGGVRDLHVLAAAILHDTVEDTGTLPEDLETAFGSEVRRLVEALSDDKSLPKAVRKRLQIEHAPHLPRPAKLIRLADLTSNLTDLADSRPARWPLRRCQEYVEWAACVAAGCRGVNPALEAAFDKARRRARRVLAR